MSFYVFCQNEKFWGVDLITCCSIRFVREASAWVSLRRRRRRRDTFIVGDRAYCDTRSLHYNQLQSNSVWICHCQRYLTAGFILPPEINKSHLSNENWKDFFLPPAISSHVILDSSFDFFTTTLIISHSISSRYFHLAPSHNKSPCNTVSLKFNQMFH